MTLHYTPATKEHKHRFISHKNYNGQPNESYFSTRPAKTIKTTNKHQRLPLIPFFYASSPLDCLNNKCNILHVCNIPVRQEREKPYKGLLNPWHTFAMRELSHLLSFNDRRRRVINTNPPQPYSLSVVLQEHNFCFYRATTTAAARVVSSDYFMAIML